jgi:hypothetical protein
VARVSGSPPAARSLSLLGAARAGARKWATKNWGWFLPLLALVGGVRGGRRVIRWSGPKLWRASKWAGRHPVRFAKWSAKAAHRRAVAGLGAMAVALDNNGNATAAARVRKVTRVLGGRTSITCGYCGAQVSADKAEAHLNAHNAQAARETAKAAADVGRTPKFVPIRPGPAPAAAAAPAPPASVPSAAASAVVATSSTGGHMSNNNGTSETVQLIRAANGVGEMDPESAWELDAQLMGLSRAALVLTENLGQYIETLDRIKVDPRVTAQAGVAVGQMAELVRTFAQTRNLFRTLYAAQFAAAESGVRQVTRPEFFDPRRAA